MSARAFAATVTLREQLSEHFVRIVLSGPGLAGFRTTGVPDEWIGLGLGGPDELRYSQSRYYTVRAAEPERLTLDIAVHEHGLVTEWASRDVEGDAVTVTEPKGSFALPEDARWLHLVGDLTALPAMARICETVAASAAPVPVSVWAETPEPVEGYLPAGTVWVRQPGDGVSALADLVRTLDLPEEPGYLWFAGESSQMRAIRAHLRAARPGLASDLMGYWRAGQPRQPRAVDLAARVQGQGQQQ